MAGAFTRRPDDDPTNIRDWLASKAGRGAGAVGAISPPAPITVPPPVNDAVEARETISPQDPRPERLLEADNSPVPVKKAEPRKADNCAHCGKPLATLRSAASRYCDRYCAKADRKRRAKA